MNKNTVNLGFYLPGDEPDLGRPIGQEVVLTDDALTGYKATIKEISKDLPLPPDTIGREQFYVRDEELLIVTHVEGHGMFVCEIPPAMWAWADNRN